MLLFSLFALLPLSLAGGYSRKDCSPADGEGIIRCTFKTPGWHLFDFGSYASFTVTKLTGGNGGAAVCHESICGAGYLHLGGRGARIDGPIEMVTPSRSSSSRYADYDRPQQTWITFHIGQNGADGTQQGVARKSPEESTGRGNYYSGDGGTYSYLTAHRSIHAGAGGGAAHFGPGGDAGSGSGGSENKANRVHDKVELCYSGKAGQSTENRAGAGQGGSVRVESNGYNLFQVPKDGAGGAAVEGRRAGQPGQDRRGGDGADINVGADQPQMPGGGGGSGVANGGGGGTMQPGGGGLSCVSHDYLDVPVTLRAQDDNDHPELSFYFKAR